MADEGLIQLLEEVAPSLDQLPKPTTPTCHLHQVPAGPPVEGDGGELSLAERLDQLDWQDDTVGQKWDKIRTAFLNAKTPADIYLDASGMQTREWLDWAVKMAPKQPETAAVQITAIRIELPSRNTLDQLGVGSAQVVEVEVPPQS